MKKILLFSLLVCSGMQVWGMSIAGNDQLILHNILKGQDRNTFTIINGLMLKRQPISDKIHKEAFDLKNKLLLNSANLYQKASTKQAVTKAQTDLSTAINSRTSKKSTKQNLLTTLTKAYKDELKTIIQLSLLNQRILNLLSNVSTQYYIGLHDKRSK